MSTPGYREIIRLIRKGDPVSPGTSNRIFRALHGNIEFVRALVDALDQAEAVLAREVTVEEAAEPGMAVYFNPDTGQFERALAAVSTGSNGQLQTAESSHVWGVVESKSQSTVARLVTFGLTDTLPVPEGNESVEAGLWFLSAVEPGKLTRERPVATTPVLRTSYSGQAFVNIQWEDLRSKHTHLRFKLVAEPAGDHTPPSQGDKHEITNPDPDKEGWLPADHSVFNGNAPVDAEFGYNLSANAALNAAWPALPPEGAVLEQDGVTVSQAPEGRVIFDRFGIWWTTACYGEVPWPTDLDTTASESASDSASDCPLDIPMQLVLYFTQNSFLTDDSVVESLQSASSLITIRCPGTEDPATRGPLEIDLDLGLQSGKTDVRSPTALKKFREADQAFDAGPVVEGIYTNSPNVALSGGSTFKKDPNDANSPTARHGLVEVGFTSAEERNVFVQLVRLDGVEEDFFQEVPLLALPQARATGYRAVIHVPDSLDISSPKLRLNMRIFAPSSGTLPNLDVTYRRIPKPGQLGSTEPLPTSDSSLTLDTSVTINSSDQYLEVESDKVDIQPGDEFLFSVARGGNDGYTDRVGILRQLGIIGTD